MGSLDQMADGRALGAAHATTTGTNTESCVYLDAAEGAGTFSTIPIPWQGDPSACPIWPKPCVDDSDYIYVAASQNGGPYAYWNMSTDEGATWRGWDSTLAGIELNTLNYDLGGHEVWAQYGDKIALVNNMGDDCYTLVYWESSNQGSMWSYDTIYCLQTTPGDSVQGYVWHSAIYDNNSYLHVVFTVTDTVPSGGGAAGSGWRSQIRHWNQQTGQISLVDNWMGWVTSNPGPGANHPTVSEPQITIWRTGGYLNCTWCYADPEDVAANGLVNMDIWGASSWDNGATWGNQRNITYSPTPGATAGYCDNDHMNHLAEEMLGDTLVMFYLNDKDAGNAAFPPDPGATLTDSPLLFYREWWCYEVETNSTITPMKFSLSVAPNPSTRNTRIAYTLSSAGNISLKLYGIDGRLVKTIYDGHKNAGVYKENLDFSGIANGIYFVILETATAKASRSVVVIH
jgi:hypothetical protein